MTGIDTVATGKNIADIFRQNGMTKTKAATAIGVTPTAVVKWCKGASMPTIDNFVVMAGMFGVRIDDIIKVAQY